MTVLYFWTGSQWSSHQIEQDSTHAADCEMQPSKQDYVKRKREHKTRLFDLCSKPTVYENVVSKISQSRGVMMTIKPNE